MRYFLLLAALATCWNAASADDVKREVVAKPRDLSKELTLDEMKAAQLKVCIQPSYDAWEKVKRGMTVEEVRALLGEPIEDEIPKSAERILLEADGKQLTGAQLIEEATRIKSEASEGVTYCGQLLYGHIEFDSPLAPRPYPFSVIYADGKVLEKWSPLFRAPLSRSDKPSIPVQTSPSYCARLVDGQDVADLRWAPSSGAYPIEYDVEVQHYYGDECDGIFEFLNDADFEGEEHFENLSIPHAAVSVGNIQRWRVRAKNKYGVSEWSPWRPFSSHYDAEIQSIALWTLRFIQEN
ncbi:MAG: hypothetical protein SGJ19_20310 [Planctomycetia bacterium]|nr:hypothetical protein [Planctomycetia bacterium]